MPIYEYQATVPSKGCSVCCKGFECIQGIDEDPLAHCPSCGRPIKRIISRCHAAVIDPSPEHSKTEQRIAEYEKAGLYSHAAELADTYSHKTKDKLLKERALENYKKAGYNFDSDTSDES
ncbi:MAG: zinc ribbon domain-containing protein [Deltaproteobacteria bacterium]|nr:zinc ribbon domain-containing protein [Deltaproteobacteria bacterium]MBW2076903.1 zinc ribbon domain-containing protein [Deltaproteobacteria bacterium]MBW2309997.1 zinc ribbon domain-containing protein [Deltaproteobacteria bacterium]